MGWKRHHSTKGAIEATATGLHPARMDESEVTFERTTIRRPRIQEHTLNKKATKDSEVPMVKIVAKYSNG